MPAALFAAILGGGAAQAADDAEAILKKMSDYVSSQKTLSIAYDTDIEVITPELQKIQFTSSGSVLLSRPDKIRATRTGGYVDLEFTFDGKTATMLGKNENVYAQIDVPGSVDNLVEKLRSNYGADMPGADLLLANIFDTLTEDVIEAAHIGSGVIDGVECEHLAFRNRETDWQIWIEAGPKPIPRKYVITSKAVAAAPQYTLRIKRWDADGPAPADAFAFKKPADAKQVEFSALSNIDEVPPVQIGASK
jgi:hypothetical protein